MGYSDCAMSRRPSITLTLLAALGWGTCLSGCKSPPSDAYMPNSSTQDLPVHTGSISEASHRARTTPHANLGPILLLVSHDATGHPIQVQVRQSSGNVRLDAKAQKLVLEKWHFPSGKSDTVLVTVEPKSLR